MFEKNRENDKLTKGVLAKDIWSDYFATSIPCSPSLMPQTGHIVDLEKLGTFCWQ